MSRIPAQLTEWLESLPDLNGSAPIDYIADRPIHMAFNACGSLGCSEDEEDRAAFKPMLQTLLNHPGLNLRVRSMNGYLHQSLAGSGLPNNMCRVALGVFAEKFGVTVPQLLQDVAPMAGKPTNSLLYIACEKALWQKDFTKVGMLLELGVPVDDNVKKLLGEDDCPYDDTAKVRRRFGGKGNNKTILQMIEDRDADPANYKFVDEDPAGEDAPPSKRVRRKTPRQFYK